LSAVNIRPIKTGEQGCLEDFLYLAVFVPPGHEPLSRDVIHAPELAISVLPEHRGRGIGAEPIGTLADELKERGYAQLSGSAFQLATGNSSITPIYGRNGENNAMGIKYPDQQRGLL
jgi:GNAT superfamily N-acetyltransferase